MKFVGFAGLTHVEGTTFWAGFGFMRNAPAEGGYGAEVLRLMCRFAVDEHGATRVVTGAPNAKGKRPAEEAGFKLVESHPPHHAKRRHGYGRLTLAWEPKD
jgi:RimJ/RimL family protein N-acetyltransferase